MLTCTITGTITEADGVTPKAGGTLYVRRVEKDGELISTKDLRATISAAVISVAVVDGGANYDAAPTVTFSGGGGQGAAAEAVVEGGVVTAINVTDGGYGYISAPAVSLGGGGSGVTFSVALATATLEPGRVRFTVPRASTVWIDAPIEKFDSRKGYGVRVEIPDVAEYELRLLMPGSGGGSTAVSQAALNAHVVKLANPDDAGHIVGVAGGLLLEDGIITGTPVSQEVVQDYLSTFFNSQTPALTFSYNDAQNRVEATIVAATTLQAGLMSAADKSALDAIPATYQALSEKNQANGYAGLDSSGLVADIRIPSSIARDSEVSAAVAVESARATTAEGALTSALGTLSSAVTAADSNLDAEVARALAAEALLQPLNANLTTISGLSPANDDILQRKAGSWANRTPAQLKTDLALVKADVGLGSADDTSDAAKPVSTAQQAAIDSASTADRARSNHTGTQSADTLTDGTTNKAFTAAERTKLSGVATGATANATDAQLRDRSTHTGTQTLSTVSDAGTAAALNAPASGDAATGEVVKGSDTRLTNARTPTAHASTHAAAGSDPLTLSESQVTGLASDLAGKQPLDATLTALAGVTTAADKLIYATGADAFSTTDLTSFARTLLDDANAGVARATLGLVIGTDVQAQDAELSALASLTSAADKAPYFTGLGTASLFDLTAFGRSLVDDASASAARTTLGLGTAATSATSDFVSATATQAANVVLAGPATGSAGAPSFRALAVADIPTLTASKLSDFTSAASAAAPVQSVAGRAGAVTIAQADVSGLTAGSSPLFAGLTAPAVNGGTAANDDITIQGTSHATRTTSYVLLQPVGGNVGIGTASPDFRLRVRGGSADQLALDNDGSQYTEMDFYNNGVVKAAFYWDNTNGRLVYGAVGTATVAFRSNGIDRLTIDTAGLVGVNKTSSVGAQLHAVAGAAGTVGAIVSSAASPTADVLQLQINGTQKSRFTKNGCLGTTVNVAPADADVNTSEVQIWFDNSAGAAKIKFKAKDSGGTVRTGEVALA
jgi:hypothetical protein